LLSFFKATIGFIPRCVLAVGGGEQRYRLDGPPRLLPPDESGWLGSRAPEDLRRLAYDLAASSDHADGSAPSLTTHGTPGQKALVRVGQYPIVTLVRWPLKIEPRYR
jgi:hypothetical protein